MKRSFDPVQLGSIEIFVKCAEVLSFSKAAIELGLGGPAVSRSIARLEDRLGAQLFLRNTRNMRLTADGQIYFEQCRQALRQIQETEETIGGKGKVPSGKLRISVPTTYGHYRVLPVLAEFMALNPAISIDVNVSNQNIDFVEQGYDLAIRLGTPQDNRLIARKLEDAALGVFASPKYIAANFEPKTPDDLKSLLTISFEMPSTGKALPWSFHMDGKVIDLKPNSPANFSEDVLGTINYARFGGGLVQTYDFIAAPYLKSGELIEVLKPYRGVSRPFSVLYPQNRHMPAKVRVFVEFLLQRLK
jgi:DNA-binding transcriptional LysR family regulator